MKKLWGGHPTAILVTSTTFIFWKQNLMCLDDCGRIGAFSLRRRYSLHQHSITGIKRTERSSPNASR